VVSPFLPKPGLVTKTLHYLGLPASGNAIENKIQLAQALDYEPMFMTACESLIFPWTEDAGRSNQEYSFLVLNMPDGEWTRRVSRQHGVFGDLSGFAVQTEADHDKLQAVCTQIEERESEIRRYFREQRAAVGEDGVIVIGHPHVPWLCGQISPEAMIYQALDYPDAFERSMEAIYQASCIVFEIALQEGIDFMSESSYGLEMVSPAQFAAQDVPYTRRLADWTHERGGLFWYHNCGQTRHLIRDGQFDRLGADVIETIAPPPEGDNNLSESRRSLSPSVCSKGNLSLGLLRDGSVEEVVKATQQMVRVVQGYAHIHSTADAVYAETPAENFIAFVQTAREEAERLA
jgi:uroporphyrinogen-III decarboxylase